MQDRIAGTKLCLMMRGGMAVVLVALCVGFVLLADQAVCATPQSTDAHSGNVIMTSLARPAYPPLAREARIAGDVEVTVRVRVDGSVDSASVERGHPMLGQAALDSAEHSRYKCVGCAEKVTSYSLVYSFQLAAYTEATNFKDIAQDGTHDAIHFSQLQNQIVVIGDPINLVIQGGAGKPDFYRARSARCLYLWKCGPRRLYFFM